MRQPVYRSYPARLHRVVDGDTVELVVDLGFDPITTLRAFRLEEIDCPDYPDTDGKAAAKAFTMRWFDQNPTVMVRTRKTRRGTAEREKYGRIVASIFPDESMTVSLNSDLVTAGHAVRRAY